jgi:hypothetical protein
VLKRALSLVVVLTACQAKDCPKVEPAAKPAVAVESPKPKGDAKIAGSVIADAKKQLIAKHGDAKSADIERGVDQVAQLWRESDGDFTAFCLEQYVPDQAGRDKLFERLQEINEQMRGHFLELGRTARWNTEVDTGPMAPVEPLLAS